MHGMLQNLCTRMRPIYFMNYEYKMKYRGKMDLNSKKNTHPIAGCSFMSRFSRPVSGKNYVNREIMKTRKKLEIGQTNLWKKTKAANLKKK